MPSNLRCLTSWAKEMRKCRGTEWKYRRMEVMLLLLSLWTAAYNGNNDRSAVLFYIIREKRSISNLRQKEVSSWNGAAKGFSPIKARLQSLISLLEESSLGRIITVWQRFKFQYTISCTILDGNWSLVTQMGTSRKWFTFLNNCKYNVVL